MKLARRGFLSSLVAMPPAVAIVSAKPMPRVEPDPNIACPPPPVLPPPSLQLQAYLDGLKRAYIEREYAQQRLALLTLRAASKVDAALAEAFDLPIYQPANVSPDCCEAEDWIVFKDVNSPGQRHTDLDSAADDYACAAQMIHLSCTLPITPEELESPETFAGSIHTEGLIASLRYRMTGGRKPLFVVSRGFRDFIPALAPIAAIAHAPCLIMRGLLSYDLERLTQVVTFEATLGLALPRLEPKSRFLTSIQMARKLTEDRLREAGLGGLIA